MHNRATWGSGEGSLWFCPPSWKLPRLPVRHFCGWGKCLLAGAFETISRWGVQNMGINFLLNVTKLFDNSFANFTKENLWPSKYQKVSWQKDYILVEVDKTTDSHPHHRPDKYFRNCVLSRAAKKVSVARSKPWKVKQKLLVTLITP